jgi:protein arginine kinase activator
MNKCQFCDNPATVELTEMVKRKKRVMFLCEACAQKHNLTPDSPSPQINLKALLELFVGTPTETEPVPTCPACGMQYPEFKAAGRLGCAADYDAFRPQLEPLLERIHRNTAHAGKVPSAFRKQARAAEVVSLKADMAAAAKAEDYEEAARLRDLIRQKEATDEPR